MELASLYLATKAVIAIVKDEPLKTEPVDVLIGIILESL